MMQSLAWKKVLWVVVFVRWKDFTDKFSSFIWKSSKVERETRQVVQTGKHAWQTVFDDTFSKSSDVQEGEFVLFEINKFKFLSYSFTTNSHGGFVRWSLWKTRRNKLMQLEKKKNIKRKELLPWSDNILCKWQNKIYFTFVSMCKWEQNQEKKSFKVDKELKHFHLARRFKNCSELWQVFS